MAARRRLSGAAKLTWMWRCVLARGMYRMRVRRVADKIQRAVWLALVRWLGRVNGQAGTSLAVRFYGRCGMRFHGRPTYIDPSAWFDSSKSYSLITLHAGCNISRDVRVLTHDWAPYCTFKSLGREGTSPVGRLKGVEVGPHAFVGLGVVLMPGAKIGRGAVVGAGAVVRGEVPDYAIVIGNPGRIVGDARDYVRSRFPEEWGQLEPAVRSYTPLEVGRH